VLHPFFLLLKPVFYIHELHMIKELGRSEKEKFYQFLMGFVSENKAGKFSRIIRDRTRHLTIVMEDLFQQHNTSAVLRSCDCFGIQDVHIIENFNKYEVNPAIALGSSKWINIFRYNQLEDNSAICFEKLKTQGYRIIAATPHKQGFTPESLPLENKIALVFGTEYDGLSLTAINMADGFVGIPMFGFTESFNISVSAALLLRALIERLHHSAVEWQLSDEEKLDVQIQWAKNVIKRADLLEKDFLKKIKK
jgi:tRNA (guanosine-2'-O-)-methyltransferase